MKGLRKILRVSWTAKKTNEWVLNKAGVNDIRVAAGEGKCTVLLAVDISAAFAVDHTILCQRLESLFGLNGTALSLITSFLSDRSQYVAVGNERSETVRCVSGVLQGSVLGPLLFSLYVAPVSDIIEGHPKTLQYNMTYLWFFSERELTFTFAICYRPSVCLSVVCLSVVCL